MRRVSSDRVSSARTQRDAREHSAAASGPGESIELLRRGRWHGWFAVEDRADDAAPRELVPAWARRWHAGQPLVLPAFAAVSGSLTPDLSARRRSYAELQEYGGLLAYLNGRREALEPHFTVHGHVATDREAPLAIERVRCVWSADPARRGPLMRDLWVESAWLSDDEADDSLAIRIGFGNGDERTDGLDLARHRRAAELAELVLPEAGLLHQSEELTGLVEAFAGCRILYAQHAACWIGREGGAGFRDGTFPVDALGRDLGASWVQLDGRTLWLALTFDELVRSVTVFGRELVELPSAWLFEQLFPAPAERARFAASLAQEERLRAELRQPHGGVLRGLLNRGPEFTSFLADAGHAYLLLPGDVLLLPQHAAEHCAVYSCFGVDELPAHGLWTSMQRSELPQGITAVV
jgi:hypothetical protein